MRIMTKTSEVMKSACARVLSGARVSTLHFQN